MQRRTALLVVAWLIGAKGANTLQARSSSQSCMGDTFVLDLGAGVCTKKIRVVMGALKVEISAQELINALREDHGA